ncbi:ComF family protein [Peribacillus kribbensis]|uniref:ComF family protein n=1 Tax=Peribacillus kribbensis TaxID=356658 RepID=UPI000418B021|nr:ComF family protein [Peribacillus kribbensis]
MWNKSYCLYCELPLEEETTWKSLFLGDEKKNEFCTECLMKLQAIEGKRCKICSRPQDEEGICRDCQRWEEDPAWQGVLSRNLSLYTYNEFLKELMARYKYRGDYILIFGFKKQLKKILAEVTFDLAVPIPLSKERLFERGFNQSEAGLAAMDLRPIYALKRKHSEKQSKKSREERIHLEEVFLPTEEDISGKNILLFDDIYTTGSTLRHAGRVLKESGALQISSITIARS